MAKRFLSLDLGDQWIGSAISDQVGVTAQPYKTIEVAQLHNFIKETTAQENITTIIIGYPLTLRGTESQQTHSVMAEKKKLEAAFPTIKWILWDERLSSKLAEKLRRATTKREKLRAHSIAAAFVLQSYLDFCALHRENKM